MTKYVAGLLFDNDATKVALIFKEKGPPALLKKWNAIGGKVEPGESSMAAMVREFAEEAGVKTWDWDLFMCLKGPGDGGWRVDFYRAFSSKALTGVRTVEAETVAVFPTVSLPMTVPNLTWIMPMALSMSNDKFEVTEVSWADSVRMALAA